MIVKTDGSFAALINATDRTHVLVPPQPRPGHRGEPRHRGLQLLQPGQRVQVEVTVLRQDVRGLIIGWSGHRSFATFSQCSSKDPSRNVRFDLVSKDP